MRGLGEIHEHALAAAIELADAKLRLAVAVAALGALRQSLSASTKRLWLNVGDSPAFNAPLKRLAPRMRTPGGSQLIAMPDQGSRIDSPTPRIRPPIR